MTAIHVVHAAEIWTVEGPSGNFVEVLSGKLVDFGGNVLAEGSADYCVRKQKRLFSWQRRASRLIPTEWRPVDGEVIGATYTWQGVPE